MIDIQTDDCLKSLQEYQAKLERELQGRTIKLLSMWINRTEQLTPKGDIVKFLGLYEQRQEDYGYDIRPGLLMGNWQMYTQGEQTSGFIQRYDISEASLQEDRRSMTFKLGDTVVLSNSTPYLGFIEDGGSRTQAPNGIKTPVLNAILDLYKIPFGDMLRG